MMAWWRLGVWKLEVCRENLVPHVQRSKGMEACYANNLPQAACE